MKWEDGIYLPELPAGHTIQFVFVWVGGGYIWTYYARHRVFCIKNLAIISHVLFVTTWDSHVDFFLMVCLGKGPNCSFLAVFSNASSQLWGRLADCNWLGGWPPSFSVRTTTFRSNRSVQRRQVKWVMGDFRTPGGSPVGWFRKQALCECDDAWLGDSISFGKLSMKSCTM